MAKYPSSFRLSKMFEIECNGFNSESHCIFYSEPFVPIFPVKASLNLCNSSHITPHNYMWAIADFFKRQAI